MDICQGIHKLLLTFWVAANLSVFRLGISLGICASTSMCENQSDFATYSAPC